MGTFGVTPAQVGGTCAGVGLRMTAEGLLWIPGVLGAPGCGAGNQGSGSGGGGGGTELALWLPLSTWGPPATAMASAHVNSRKAHEGSVCSSENWRSRDMGASLRFLRPVARQRCRCCVSFRLGLLIDDTGRELRSPPCLAPSEILTSWRSRLSPASGRAHQPHSGGAGTRFGAAVAGAPGRHQGMQEGICRGAFGHAGAAHAGWRAAGAKPHAVSKRPSGLAAPNSRVDRLQKRLGARRAPRAWGYRCRYLACSLERARLAHAGDSLRLLLASQGTDAPAPNEAEGEDL